MQLNLQDVSHVLMTIQAEYDRESILVTKVNSAEARPSFKACFLEILNSRVALSKEPFSSLTNTVVPVPASADMLRLCRMYRQTPQDLLDNRRARIEV